MNFSVAMMYSNVDSFINAFPCSMRPFDPKMNVSTTITSFWFNKERLMLLIFVKKGFFFDLSNLSVGKGSE